jgi:hypothetical protein
MVPTRLSWLFLPEPCSPKTAKKWQGRFFVSPSTCLSFILNGSPGWIRTTNLLSQSQTLCQLSYRALGDT